jgi:hypothetical protein
VPLTHLVNHVDRRLRESPGRTPSRFRAADLALADAR